MNTFSVNESYKHKMAKEVLKEWFYGGDNQLLDYICPNRKCGVWFEYPIVKNKDYNSINYNWDEILDNPNDSELGKLIRLKYLKSAKNEECPICGEEKKCCDNK
jgi:hypothetical protein